MCDCEIRSTRSGGATTERALGSSAGECTLEATCEEIAQLAGDNGGRGLAVRIT